MNTKTIRNFTFYLHRYLGLSIGLIASIIGLTGSLLVFQKELDAFLLKLQFGRVIPQEKSLPIPIIFDTVQEIYKSIPELKISLLNLLQKPDQAYQFWLRDPTSQWINLYIDPYSGKILGTRQWEKSLIGLIFQLHHQLLAGDMGRIVAGVVAFLLFFLCLSGLVLWPGWRKLIVGFQIKWPATPQRVSFDLHKLVGIIVVIFLGINAFIGFCWNFSQFTEPAIHTVTLTPKLAPPVSDPTLNKPTLSLSEILQKADVALPGAATTLIFLPDTPEGTFIIGKKFPQEREVYGFSRIYLEQYTGEVLQVQNSLNPRPAERVFNTFILLHHGTFGGLTTRIFYVFFGLAPTVLFITDLIMWRLRSKVQSLAG